MEILVGYGVVPRMERIICHYWDHLSMVTQSGHCYRAPFKVYQGVAQGYSLSSTIFKVVVDAMIQYWVTSVSEEEVGIEGFGRAVQWIVSLLYVENVIHASSWTNRLKEVLYVLTGVFIRVGLQNNVK